MDCPAEFNQGPAYKAYTLPQFRKRPQWGSLTAQQRHDMEVVGSVFPFKANRYVTEQLIDWNDIPQDPMFQLTFPQRGMLRDDHYRKMATVLGRERGLREARRAADEIRGELNPHPAGQREFNIPSLDGVALTGMQHKYRETVLFFPKEGQTCHAYCSFCFRWPQFVGTSHLKFAMRDLSLLVAYLRRHPEVTDVLFTGGDPLIMKTDVLRTYIAGLLAARLPGLRTIRIGTKALSYWPYRFLTDGDADGLLGLFAEVVRAGKHLALMAHFNHPRELSTAPVREAVARILGTGAQIRTQAPVLAHINDSPEIWEELWREQIGLGCIPYYMFVMRDTGAQHYFGIPLAKALTIYQTAIRNLSGLAKTVRGPVMSATPGKVLVSGVPEVNGEKLFLLQFLQARKTEWLNRPFFAKYDERAIWLNDLKPALGDPRFFFEENY